MQFDTSEVQATVTDYLRRRGVVVDDASRVQVKIVDESGTRLKIVGCSPVRSISDGVSKLVMQYENDAWAQEWVVLAKNAAADLSVAPLAPHGEVPS